MFFIVHDFFYLSTLQFWLNMKLFHFCPSMDLEMLIGCLMCYKIVSIGMQQVGSHFLDSLYTQVSMGFGNTLTLKMLCNFGLS